MRKIALMTLIALAAPVLAEELSKDTVLGTTMDEVKTSLTEMGYEVRKIETEDGKLEVYFVKENKIGKAYVNRTTGQITKLEIK
ncbi:PepSY domain-containing protein [Sedimentitalea sp. HM32M-2]|uniref:PepSY domain-containing protein n=1 Tax=Sedimentitalea sp. HM32M-2 TaxID=3351566 RepID=UPI003636ABB5